MESTQDKHRAFSITDPVGLLTCLLILGGLLGIGFYAAGFLPLPGLIGGAVMLFLAWICATQAESPKFRKQGAPMAAISLVLYVWAEATSLAN